MYRFEITHAILNRLSGKTYLEIGVESGKSFLPVIAQRKIAVDPNFTDLRALRKLSSNTASELLFFKLRSDDFFRLHKELFSRHPIDVAFIDGLHTYKQSLNDVENCLTYLAKKGVIVMHDCNPSSMLMAYPSNSYEEVSSLDLPGWTGEWCGDVWKTIVHLRSARSDLRVVVLDSDYGLGLIWRGIAVNKLHFSPDEINLMTYEDLDANRESLLNLRPPEDFYRILDELVSN